MNMAATSLVPRLLRHLFAPSAARRFPADALQRIAAAVVLRHHHQ